MAGRRCATAWSGQRGELRREMRQHLHRLGHERLGLFLEGLAERAQATATCARSAVLRRRSDASPARRAASGLSCSNSTRPRRLRSRNAGRGARCTGCSRGPAAARADRPADRRSRSRRSPSRWLRRRDRSRSRPRRAAATLGLPALPACGVSGRGNCTITVISSPRTAAGGVRARSRTELARERRRSSAERARPGLHAFGRHPAEAVLHLGNERVVLEPQLLGELDLRQARPPPAVPSASPPPACAAASPRHPPSRTASPPTGRTSCSSRTFHVY